MPMSRPASRSARAPCRGAAGSTCRRRPSATSWPISRRPGCCSRRIPRPGACRPRPGLRLFVNGLLEVGGLSEAERREHRRPLRRRRAEPVPSAGAGDRTLSGLSHCAGLVRRAQDRAAAEAYRVRAAGAGPRAGRHGDRGRAGREPAHRGAARARRPRLDRRPATTSRAGWSAAPSTRRGAAIARGDRCPTRAELDELTEQAGRGRSRLLGGGDAAAPSSCAARPISWTT